MTKKSARKTKKKSKTSTGSSVKRTGKTTKTRTKTKTTTKKTATKKTAKTKTTKTKTSTTKTKKTSSPRSKVGGKKRRPETKKEKKARKQGFSIVPRQTEATEIITERLEETRGVLAEKGIDASRPTVSQYANGEVDGELLCYVPRGVSAADVSRRLEEAFGTTQGRMRGAGYWFSLGTRLSIKKSEESERSGEYRVRGKDDLAMYYRRVTTPAMIDSFLRAQKVMIPGAEAKYRRKAETVYIRVYWSPDGERPER